MRKIKTFAILMAFCLVLSALTSCGGCMPGPNNSDDEENTDRPIITKPSKNDDDEDEDDTESATIDTGKNSDTDVEESSDIDTEEGSDIDTEKSSDTEAEEICYHTNTSVMQEIAPTCSKNGLTEGEKCTNCEVVITEQNIIAKTNSHTFGEWTLVEAGGCSEQAYYFRVCHICEKIEYDLAFTGITHPHDFILESKPATCLEDGIIKVYCKNCGIVGAEETIEATGHNFKWTITSTTHSAYCRNAGCDYIVALGEHTANTDSVCVNQYCSVCHYLMRSGIGHDFEDGYSYNSTHHWKECERENCDYYNSHNKHVSHTAICTDTSAICEICGAEFVPSDNHVYTAWYVVTYPTCDTLGLERRDCIYCDHYEEREKSCREHECDDWTTILEPTCTEKGKKTGFCKHCHSEVIVEIPALNHDCDNWTTIIEPTCTTSGRKTGVCKRCSADLIETIPALGHDCDNWTVVKEATCTENGERTGICKRCAADLVETIYASHQWSENYSYNSVCHWETCLKCNAIKDMEIHKGKEICTQRTTCDTCGVQFGDIIQHNFSETLSYNQESHFNACKRGCGSNINIEPHNFTSKIETLTVSDTGDEKIYSHKFYLVCNICNYEHLYDEEEAHEHYGCDTYPAKDPTCTEEGLTLGWGCSVAGCGEVYKAQEVIPALGHDYVNRVCSRCGDILYSEGLEFEYIDESQSYSVVGIGDCTDNVLYIPPTYMNKPVTSIGSYAFRGCTSLTSVTIPEGVTSIGGQAFDGCSSLGSITIPNTVTKIAISAFRGCEGLTSVHISDIVAWCEIWFDSNYASNPLTYAQNLYLNGQIVENLVIPNDVTGIGDSTFFGCKSLKTIIIPESVTYIGSSAFYDCSNLASINIPRNVESIGSGAFYNCSSLTSVTIPDSVTSIGNAMFSGCSSLTTINIPDSVTSIGNAMFSGCSSLTTIDIPDSVTSIDNYAFSRCSSLTSVTIGDGVTSIGSYVFEGCLSLKSITVNENNENYKSINGNLYSKDGKKLIQYAIAKTDTSFAVPDNVTSIDNYAFSGCSSLTSIVIPNSVTSIGYYAFYKCSSLTSISIGNGVTSIGAAAFENCSNLKSVIGLENSQLTSIGNSAFRCCSSLTSIDIPDSVTSIGDMAFEYCSSITSITIPKNITSISFGAFRYCDSLASVNIGDNVTTIGDKAFSGCHSLANINIPNSVTTIDIGAFYACSSLTTIGIPESVTSIGDSAFFGCSSLTSIIVDTNNANYKSINGNLYSKDGKTIIQYATGKADKSFAIPDSVTSISDRTFYDCPALISIIIPDSVTSIGDSAFFGMYGGSNLKTVYYMGSEEAWAKISIERGNSNLTNAEIIYNYVPEE